MFDWKQFMVNVCKALPKIIEDIESVHGDSKDGASKLQLVKDGALAAGSLGQVLDPSDKQVIADAGELIDHAIGLLQRQPVASNIAPESTKQNLNFSAEE